MPTAQDHALIQLAAQRGWLGPDGVQRARAALRRLGPGEPLAQALLAAGLLRPATATDLLRELARARYACAACGTVGAYDALAGLRELACPCGGRLAIAAPPPEGGRDGAPSGLAHSLRPSDGSGVGPRTLGPYRLEQELGRGSNGVVYVARRPGLERRFALKVLLDGASDPEGLSRFLQEAAVASRIDDPGVVAVYDVGREGEQHYLAMELVAGPTLARRIKGGPLPPEEAARIVERLARTVQRAHEHGVVHRDLKPANVILEEGTGRPRILDFGLARDTSRRLGMTRQGDILGTPYYMAPEQIDGAPDMDHRIDVYALGVILYEALTGVRPFEAKSVLDLAVRIREGRPRAPRALAPAVPEALEAVCLRAMHRARHERYPDARALADALEAFLAGRSAGGRGPDGPAAGGRPRRRRRAPLGLALGLVLGLGAAGGAVVLAVGARRGGAGDAPEGDAPRAEPAPGPRAEPADAGGPPGRPEEVAAALERAAALARERLALDRVLAEVEAAHAAAGADRALALRVAGARAAHLARRGRWAEVRDALARVGPVDAEALGLEAARAMALAAEGLDDLAAARAGWEAVANLAPVSAPGLAAEAALLRLRADHEGAEARAARALAEDAADLHALGELARARLARGHGAAALEALRGAPRHDDVTLLTTQARAAAACGQQAEALHAATAAVSLGEPAPPVDALVLRGRLLTQEGRLDQGLSDLDRALARAPDDVTGLVARGAALWLLSGAGDETRRDAARSDWRRAARADAARADAALGHAPLAVRVEARAAMAGALEATPGAAPLAPEASAHLAALAAGPGVPERAREPLERALRAAGLGLPWGAIGPALDDALRAAPDAPEVARLAARLLMGRERLADGLAACDKALRLGARAEWAERVAAEAMYRQGRSNEAVKGWERLAARAPDAPDGRLARAWAAFARGEREQALSALDGLDAPDGGPDAAGGVAADALVLRAIIAFNAQDPDASRRALDALAALQGALDGRVASMRAVNEATALIRRTDARGDMSPLARIPPMLEAAFPLTGASFRLTCLQLAIEAGLAYKPLVAAGRRWLEDARSLDPGRYDLLVYEGMLELAGDVPEPRARGDAVLAHWLEAQRRHPRLQIPADYVDLYRRVYGDRPELAGLSAPARPGGD